MANLDGDREWERLAVERKGDRQRVVLVDRCRGERVRHALTRFRDAVDRLEVLELDGVTARPEILVDVRDGAAGRVGAVRVLRLTGGGCPAPRALFHYAPERPPVAPPRGFGVVDFRVETGDHLPGAPGRELRLRESLFGPGDTALCCPSRERISLFVYAPRLGRYSMAASVVRPAP